MTVLVTGAAGNVGRVVVELLLAAGVPVRALTRDPRRVFPGGVDTDFHLPVERAAEESGLEWTHVRPGEFALNKLWLWGRSIREERVVRDPFPEAAWFPTHERDIAEVAAAALLEEGHAGAAYDVNGPEMIGNREQVRAIAAAVGHEIRHERVSREEAHERYLRQGGFAAANAAFLLGFADYSGSPAAEPAEVPPAPDLPTCEPVTGQRGRTFAQWARDHADDFR